MLREVLIICAAATTCFSAIPNTRHHSFDSSQDVLAVPGNRESGISLYKERKYREAIDRLKKAIKENKSDYEAWYYLGLTQIQLDDFKKAIESFEKVLELKPDDEAAYVGLSYSLLRRNKPEEAVRISEKALLINPGIPEAHYIIGVVSLREDNREEALRRADLAITLNPAFAGAYLLKSQALVRFIADVPVASLGEPLDQRKDRFQEAKDALEQSLRLDPSPPHKETWVDQLAALKFHVLPAKEQQEILTLRSTKEVTTKVRILSKPEPSYTDVARTNGTAGTVVLRAIFAADGSVKHILVLRALPDGLTEASIKAAQKIRFTPAVMDQRPVSVFMQLEYNFNVF